MNGSDRPLIRAHGGLKKLDNSQLVEYARGRSGELGARTRTEFQRADRVLFDELRQRGVDDEVGFEKPAGKARGHRDWKSKTIKELIEIGNKTVKDNRISNKTRLRRFDVGLCKALERAGLLDKLEYDKGAGAAGNGRRKYRGWKGMSDAQRIEAVNAVVSANGILNRTELGRLDQSMAAMVKKYGLGERIVYCRSFSGASIQQTSAVEPCTTDQEKIHGFAKEEIQQLAQSIINDLQLETPMDLEALDKEMYDAAVALGVESELVFHQKEPKTENGEPETLKVNWEDRAEPPLEWKDLNSEQLRKLDLRYKQVEDGMMYRIICAECFRMGNGHPFVGSHRSTVPKLQSGLHRRLGGPQHRVFEKCWERMAVEGAIVYNTNRSAASLNPFAGVRDPDLRKALEWAVGEQVAATPEWNARYKTMLNPHV